MATCCCSAQKAASAAQHPFEDRTERQRRHSIINSYLNSFKWNLPPSTADWLVRACGGSAQWSDPNLFESGFNHPPVIESPLRLWALRWSAKQQRFSVAKCFQEHQLSKNALSSEIINRSIKGLNERGNRGHKQTYFCVISKINLTPISLCVKD